MNDKNKFEFYDEEQFSLANERAKRLEEIEQRENFLRKEKLRLQNEKPWYKKPQNLIAIFGILFPIIVSILISQSNDTKKELTVEYSNIEPLIVESSSFGNNVSIKYDSTDINNISRVKFRIINSGTLDIEKGDFVDGPLKIFLKSKLVNQDLKLFKISKKNNAGQQNAILEFESLNKESSFTYLPSLLNKGDEVTLDLYLIDPVPFNFDIKGKIKNGKVKGPILSKNEEFVLGYKTFVLSINSFFKYKWLTIGFLVILFIITGISALFIFAMGEDIEAPILTIIMGGVVTLVATLDLAVIISLIVYT
ncbi:hypothetical protein EZY14_007250 [Kordia sp. TARA_039_SRF]|nr:hypothetical protein EZY14_007250 [Kordia sp. TARA_039_SRF]